MRRHMPGMWQSAGRPSPRWKRRKRMGEGVHMARSAASEAASRNTTIRENFVGSAGAAAGLLVPAATAAAAEGLAAVGKAAPCGAPATAATSGASASGAGCPAALSEPVSSTTQRITASLHLLPAAFMAASWGGCGGRGRQARGWTLPPATCSGAAAPPSRCCLLV